MNAASIDSATTGTHDFVAQKLVSPFSASLAANMASRGSQRQDNNQPRNYTYCINNNPNQNQNQNQNQNKQTSSQPRLQSAFRSHSRGGSSHYGSPNRDTSFNGSHQPNYNRNTRNASQSFSYRGAMRSTRGGHFRSPNTSSPSQYTQTRNTSITHNPGSNHNSPNNINPNQQGHQQVGGRMRPQRGSFRENNAPYFVPGRNYNPQNNGARPPPTSHDRNQHGNNTGPITQTTNFNMPLGNPFRMPRSMNPMAQHGQIKTIREQSFSNESNLCHKIFYKYPEIKQEEWEKKYIQLNLGTDNLRIDRIPPVIPELRVNENEYTRPLQRLASRPQNNSQSPSTTAYTIRWDKIPSVGWDSWKPDTSNIDLEKTWVNFLEQSVVDEIMSESNSNSTSIIIGAHPLQKGEEQPVKPIFHSSMMLKANQTQNMAKTTVPRAIPHSLQYSGQRVIGYAQTRGNSREYSNGVTRGSRFNSFGNFAPRSNNSEQVSIVPDKSTISVNCNDAIPNEFHDNTSTPDLNLNVATTLAYQPSKPVFPLQPSLRFEDIAATCQVPERRNW